MNHARASILARLRIAQRTAVLPKVTPGPPPQPISLPSPDRLPRFREELNALGVENHLEGSPADVRKRVAALVEGRRLLSWDPEHLPYDLGSLLNDAAFGASAREEQASAELGLTGCDAAIAETGTLVLLSGKGRSRAVSLLPPVHLAVVRRGDVLFSMGELFRTQAERLAGAASCTLVTGPSRTADIELTLTLGVHGPGQVMVVIGP